MLFYIDLAIPLKNKNGIKLRQSTKNKHLLYRLSIS